MKIYLVIRQATYDHGVFGVYDSFRSARKGLSTAQGMERDSHHDFRIDSMNLNQDCPKKLHEDTDYNYKQISWTID